MKSTGRRGVNGVKRLRPDVKIIRLTRRRVAFFPTAAAVFRRRLRRG